MSGLGYKLTDLLVIAACSLAFVALISPGRYEPKNPPSGPVAQDPGAMAGQFRSAEREGVPN